MEAWLGLIGALLGAAIGFVAQHLSARAARADESQRMLADASSVVVALAEDYKNRVWEQRNGLSNDSVAGWNFRESSLAQARIQILTGDEGLLSAERTLSRAGTALGRAVRLDTGDVEELELAWQAYKAALENFVAESRRVVAK